MFRVHALAEQRASAPGGTLIYISANLIHRQPERWNPDADDSKLNRWRNSGSIHPAQLLAFGLVLKTDMFGYGVREILSV